MLEGERASGDGQVMFRSEASGGSTRWLHAGEQAFIGFELVTTVALPYEFRIRYSNDNSGPLETVTLGIDDNSIGAFEPEDTGDSGDGWNVFLETGPIATVTLDPGAHQLSISVSGGDGFGVEIDRIELETTDP